MDIKLDIFCWLEYLTILQYKLEAQIDKHVYSCADIYFSSYLLHFYIKIFVHSGGIKAILTITNCSYVLVSSHWDGISVTWLASIYKSNLFLSWLIFHAMNAHSTFCSTFWMYFMEPFLVSIRLLEQTQKYIINQHLNYLITSICIIRIIVKKDRWMSTGFRYMGW